MVGDDWREATAICWLGVGVEAMSGVAHSEIALDLASRFLDCRPYGGVINFNASCAPGHMCSFHLSEDLDSAEADAKRLGAKLEECLDLFGDGWASHIVILAAREALRLHREQVAGD